MASFRKTARHRAKSEHIMFEEKLLLMFEENLPELPKTVSYNDLKREFENLFESGDRSSDHPLIVAFRMCKPETQEMFFRLVARMKLLAESRKRGGGGGDSDDENDEVGTELDVYNDTPKYLDRDVIQWILALMFGLMLLYVAKVRADVIFKEVGVDKKYVMEILTNPVNGASNTILSALEDLGKKFKEEALFEARNLCGDPRSVTNGSVSERIHSALTGVLSFYYSPGSVSTCILESSRETAHHMENMMGIKLKTNLSQTVNLVRAAYGTITPALVCISQYVLTGEKMSLTRWNTKRKSKSIVPRRGGRTTRRRTTRRRTNRRSARGKRTRGKGRRSRGRIRSKRARGRTRARRRVK